MLPAKFFEIFRLLLFFAATTFVVPAQTPTETHSKIRRAVENKEYAEASGELQRLASRDQKLFQLNNYDYLLARIAEKQNNVGAAMANYQTVVSRNSVLTEYALWHQSQIARSSGNLMLERIYLNKLLTIAPQSLISSAANSRLARSFFESRNFETAILMLEQQNRTSAEKKINSASISTTPDFKNPKIRENFALIGQAYSQMGNAAQAREIFTQLVNNSANPAQPDDFALTAAKALDEMDVGKENFGKTVGVLTETEHYRRATVYQFNRNFPLARRHFLAIVERFRTETFVSEALFQIGRGFVQEKNYDEAINWFERVQAEFPEQEIARDALSQTASTYSRLNKPKEAVSRYQKFIAKYPDAENLDRAYLNIIDVLRDQGENANALKWTAKTQEMFKGKLPEAIALFAQTRIRIAQNDWTNAIVDLNSLYTFADLGGARVPGGTNKAEIIFLKGFALENLNRFDEAITTYLSIPEGRGEYYGWRASERLKMLGKNEKTKMFVAQQSNILNISLNSKEAEVQRAAAHSIRRLSDSAEIKNQMLEVIRKTYGALPEYQNLPQKTLLDLGRAEFLKEPRKSVNVNTHQILADELLFLGIYDEAAPELEASLKFRASSLESQIQNPKVKSEDFDFTLAVFYKRGDFAHRAVSYIEPLFRQIPTDFEIELIPREQLELLYPAPYQESLVKYGLEKKVDPRFLLSIMRQESRFRADVKSYAAARGLMQFISTTSDKIASELRRENFKQDELYTPSTAILFGSHYLSNLFRLFPKQPAAVAASYNGGEDNMLRWLSRSKTDNPDRYIPEIIFTQSKDYVYKVMANYRVYQMLYDENLNKK
ncbi:MAG: transglycosylase SLT domain-containing protein [Pyrinomonadaceae bacterium]